MRLVKYNRYISAATIKHRILPSLLTDNTDSHFSSSIKYPQPYVTIFLVMNRDPIDSTTIESYNLY